MIRVQSSKTDQYRDGASLVVACTGLPTCPVAMMERYFHRGELESTHKGFVSWSNSNKSWRAIEEDWGANLH